MPKFNLSPYTAIPGTSVVRSKIDVFEFHDEYDNKTHRVELSVDNDGILITAVAPQRLSAESVSIGHKDVAIALARGILEAYGEVYV